MIGNLLTLSKMDASESIADKKMVDVADMLRKVVADADFEARDRNCHVVLRGLEHCTTVGSPDLLRSAVENVIRNAIRYTAERTEVEVRLAYETNDGASTATITVKIMGLVCPSPLSTTYSVRSFASTNRENAPPVESAWGWRSRSEL